MENPTCEVCTALAVVPETTRALLNGLSRDDLHTWLTANGWADLPKRAARRHRAHVVAGVRGGGTALAALEAEPLDVMAAHDRAVAAAPQSKETTEGYLADAGVAAPPGFQAGTLQIGADGKLERAWLRAENDKGGIVEVRQATPVKLVVHPGGAHHERLPSTRKVAFVFGDAQIGWGFDDTTDRWFPTHDPRAMDVALQLATAVNAIHGVDYGIDLGDSLDFPSLSKHDSPASVLAHGALNRSLQTSYEFDVRMGAALDGAQLEKVSGNHDVRLERFLTSTRSPLIGIRRARPAGCDLQEPVLTTAYLTRMAETGWHTNGTYPDSQFRIGSCIFIHGDCCASTNRETGAKYRTRFPTSSVAFGHDHSSGWTTYPVNVDGVIREVLVGGSGALCRTDGKVPSTRNASDAAGNPTSRREMWSQGISVLFIDPNDYNSTPVVEQISIRDGRAFWRGRDYTSRVDVYGEAL